MLDLKPLSPALDGPPLLFVGPHRSGTSLTTRMARELGVHVGARVDQNCESTFMQRLNRRILDEVGAHWSTPLEAARILRELDDVGELDSLAAGVANYLGGPLFRLEYLGRRPSADLGWGWKDPRNIVMLPIYQSIFPGMKIVWCQRNPLATALSLHRRESQREADYRSNGSRPGIRSELVSARRVLTNRPLVSPAWRTTTVEGAFVVCLEYAELHQSLVPALDSPVLPFEYGDLIERPAEFTQSLADFLGATDPAAIERAAAIPQPQGSSRPEAMTSELVRLAEKYETRLTALGYPPTPMEKIA